jgi:hypothetical protein
MIGPRVMAAAARVVPAGALLLTGLFTAPAQAAFHFMQIEQVIGGVNGDTTAQAIQLRMRTSGQNVVSFTRIKAFNASGGGVVTLVDLTSDVSVPNGRILIATPNFANYVTPAFGATPAMGKDFNMTPIPAGYLAAGRITFEDDFGTILWSLSWGGTSYTGSTLGSVTNDADGNFGPSFAGPCPSTSLQALLFQGAAGDLSTNNAADYALTPGPAEFFNNAGTKFTVTTGATSTTVTQWRSVRTHNVDGALSITLNPTAAGNGSSGPTVETRSGGIQTIQADFSAPVTLTATPAAGITVSDGTNSYSPTTVVPVDADTIAINFNPGVLPDQACYTLTIGAGTVTQTLSGDLDVKVRALAGDTTGNGVVNLSDAILTNIMASSAAAAAPQHDVDLSGGAIALNDALFIKALVASPPLQALCP